MLTWKGYCGDYESELVVVISEPTEIILETDALDSILGHTACIDFFSRFNRFAQSLW
jgi:2-keto-4-pentenoate hydratase/2-oxohepta-3-ene-1,7-dioic acid hydratase in catechol pathway